ncbi:MAG: hypothetical protein FWD26_09785 [Treponema sp.]|nr:hypothetical protein [Treponema sp.]
MEKKATGFASPTQGYEEQGIDLNRLLIQNPPAIYFGRLETDDMERLGLSRGTLLLIDRSKNPVPGSFVLIRHDGQFFCRLMTEDNGKTAFSNGKETINPIPDDTEIIGTVTASIKTYGEKNGFSY